jgi:hypothetical protein
MIVENAASGRRIRDPGNRGPLDLPPSRMAIRWARVRRGQNGVEMTTAGAAARAVGIANGDRRIGPPGGTPTVTSAHGATVHRGARTIAISDHGVIALPGARTIAAPVLGATVRRGETTHAAGAAPPNRARIPAGGDPKAPAQDASP